jgi:hypothetical protein
MQPLPLLVRGGAIESLAPFLNLTSENDFVHRARLDTAHASAFPRLSATGTKV